MRDEAFVAYLDDDDREQRRYVEVLERTNCYLRFRNGEAVITIPWARVLKLKERGAA